MSSYPGEDKPTDPTPGEPEDEAGYWERKAAEDAAAAPAAPAPTPPNPYPFTPPSPTPEPPVAFNPQSGYGQAGQTPYGPPGSPVPPANPYGTFTPMPPNHNQAGLALGLGIASLAGGMVCCLPILAAPFAWAIGHRSLREVRAANGQLGGEGMAMTGMVLGIIGSVLLGLAVIALIVFAIVLVATSGTNGGTGV
jgi:hypothetical protein